MYKTEFASIATKYILHNNCCSTDAIEMLSRTNTAIETMIPADLERCLDELTTLLCKLDLDPGVTIEMLATGSTATATLALISILQDLIEGKDGDIAWGIIKRLLN